MSEQWGIYVGDELIESYEDKPFADYLAGVLRNAMTAQDRKPVKVESVAETPET